MSFEESLADGSAGVELRFPAAFQRKESLPEFAELLDEDAAIVWRCSLSPFPLDLGPEHETLLQVQIERSARQLFDQVWDSRHPSGADPGERRTADESWSPVIASDRVEVGGATALRVLHRLGYEPEYEHVSLKLMIPVRTGTLEIAAHAVDSMTGVRESTISLTRSAEEALHHPGQAFFDDPARDADFPDHALTRARAAERWLLGESGLRVLRPLLLAPRGLVALRAARCALVPPPRHLELPAAALGMPETMTNFARVDLDATDPTLFEVWHVEDSGVAPGDGAALCALAEETARGWTDEGAEGVQAQARFVSTDEFTEVDCDVRFLAGGREIVAVQRWLADAHGRVWRLALSGDVPIVPVEEARAQIEAVRASFRAMAPGRR